MELKRGSLTLLLLCLLFVGCSREYAPPRSPYTPEDFYYDGDYLACSAGSYVTGIDVSYYQGDIDWQAVAESGIRFVIVRLGYRSYRTGELHEDICAREYLAGARAAGLKVGAYFFSQAVTAREALEEAEYARQVLDGYQLDLPLVYDWEYISDTARTAAVTREELTEFTVTFCREVGKFTRPAVYFNPNQARDLLDLSRVSQYTWWLAKYTLETPFPCRVDMYQYGFEGNVPGIAGNVDLDMMFTDYGIGKELFP